MNSSIDWGACIANGVRLALCVAEGKGRGRGGEEEGEGEGEGEGGRGGEERDEGEGDEDKKRACCIFNLPIGRPREVNHIPSSLKLTGYGLQP